MESFPHNVMILGDSREIAESEPIWGSGGWLPPEERRALDWHTLCRMAGLRPRVIECGSFYPASVDDDIHWLILAYDPAAIEDDLIRRVEAVLAKKPVTIICQIPTESSPLAEWLGVHMTHETHRGSRVTTPGWAEPCEWTCRKAVEIHEIESYTNVTTLACLDVYRLIVSIPSRMGRVIITGFDTSVMRDADGGFSRLLQRLLVFSSPVPLPWFDWSHTLVLRMDDPGSCEALYNQRYHTTKLNAGQWSALGHELAKRKGRLSVCYVTGWVDVGDDMEGMLEIQGEKVERISGKVYASPSVRFERRSEMETLTYDHVGEYQAIRRLMDAGLVGVELHGYTHVSPDRQAWIKAHDRYTDNSWFREFGQEAQRYLANHPEIPHPIGVALNLIKVFFGVRPTSLIFPGEEFTHQALVKALEEGFPLVSSYYLAIRDGGRFCWAQHVCAPYLDLAGDKWFDAALPVVGYFHDFDIAENGIGWFAECLDQWQHAGARRIIDLGELAALLGMKIAIRKADSGWELDVKSDGGTPPPRAFELKIYFPDGNIPSVIACTQDGKRRFLPVIHTVTGGASVLIGT